MLSNSYANVPGVFFFTIILFKDRQRWLRVYVHLVLRFLWYLSYSSFNLDVLLYQIKAEYLSYRIVPVILLLVKAVKKNVLKRTKIVIFFHNFFERRYLI